MTIKIEYHACSPSIKNTKLVWRENWQIFNLLPTNSTDNITIATLYLVAWNYCLMLRFSLSERERKRSKHIISLIVMVMLLWSELSTWKLTIFSLFHGHWQPHSLKLSCFFMKYHQMGTYMLRIDAKLLILSGVVVISLKLMSSELLLYLLPYFAIFSMSLSD